ncbi:MAG: hypothetical protein ISS71_06660 [Phycisphaerae bacterium]|nr:hypothetical protein [Phycisphaerae bacterium]
MNTAIDISVMDDELCKTVLWPLNKFFGLNKGCYVSVLWRCFLFLGIPPLILIAVSWHEQTLFIEGADVGLLEHFGFLVFFIIHGLLILLLPRTIDKCSNAFKHVNGTIDYFEVQEQKVEGEVEAFFNRINKFINLAKYSKIKLLAIFVGVISVIYNAFNTIAPEKVYHHGVWDGLDHIGGYIAAKIYLLFTWGFILPIIIYAFFVSCILIFYIYSHLSKIGPSGVVLVRPLSPDKVGGLKHINEAMISIVINIFPLGLFTVALIFVHGLTLPLIVWTTGWIVLLCGIFFLPLSSVHVAMSKRKQLIVGEIEDKFNRLNDKLRQMLRDDSSKEDIRLAETLKSMEQLHTAYRIAEKMPIWPFDFSSLAKFSSVLIVHMVLTVVSGLVGKIL